jgi:hypothetical protein
MNCTFHKSKLQLLTQCSASWTLNQFKCELARTELVATGLPWPSGGLSNVSVFKLSGM